ncbi:MAG TPA: sulfite exporter TauE/SafE family protein [Thermoplasmatales archaeon]|nr:sulfite exporter TauE/SafE family protein [Thermoplasmatales archaeon]
MLKKISETLKIRNEWLKKTISICTGIWVGVMSGLFGASGGIWFLAILFLLFGLPLHKSVGGAAFLMMLTAFSATMAHVGYGQVNLTGGLLVGIGAAVSGKLSAKFANKSTEKVLIKSIAVLLVVLGLFMVMVNITGFSLH